MQIEGRVAIVTGAGQGIGEATARLFAAEGASVAAVDVNATTGDAVADDIRRGGGSARFFQADVSDSGDVRRMADEVADALGGIDVLVNVAGIQGMVADAVELPEAEWRRVVDTNLTSIYLCSKYCIPHMLRPAAGR